MSTPPVVSKDDLATQLATHEVSAPAAALAEAPQADSLALSRCSALIRPHLQATPKPSVEVFALLKTFEIKERVVSVEGKDWISASATRACSMPSCLDVRWPPSWVAHRRCDRCKAIELLLCVSDVRESSSFVGSAIIGAALLHTECQFATQRNGAVPTLPTLPLELIEMIVAAYFHMHKIVRPHQKGDCYVSSPTNRATYDQVMSGSYSPLTGYGLLVGPLMHTSRYFRLFFAQPWPVKVCRSKPRPREARHPKHRVSDVHLKVNEYMDALVRWFHLDVSEKHLPPALPDCREDILTIEKKPVHWISFEVVSVHQQQRKLSSLEFKGTAERQVSKRSRPLTVRDACELLQEAMLNTRPNPRSASVYARSCLDMSSYGCLSGIHMGIKMVLPYLAKSRYMVSPKIWTFENRTACCYNWSRVFDPPPPVPAAPSIAIDPSAILLSAALP